MKVLIFPQDSNPYQELLYTRLRDKVETAYLDISQQSLLRFVSFYPFLIAGLIKYRLRGYRILHLHWIYPFYVPGWVPLHRRLAYLQIKLFYVITSILGYKIVWTVHNAVPQFPQTTNDEVLMQRLGEIAKAKIIHSTSALDILTEHHIPVKNTHHIPHGNYEGVYPDTITRAAARRKLALQSKDIVFLFFGNIAPYKGVDALLSAFDHIKAPSNLRLVIAGQCYNDELRNRILRSAKGGRIIFNGGYINDEDVAVYFKAADAVCLPFNAITTSGSAVLALTFGKPLITPRLGALKDVPESAGYFYDPSDANGLHKALIRAVSDKKGLAAHGNAAHSYAQTLDWDSIAQKTYKVYRKVLTGAADGNN